MQKSLFEQLGGTYHEENVYLIPDLRLPEEEEKKIGIWGQQHLEYLKQHRKVTYTNLLTSSRLDTYLVNIDKQAQKHFERRIEGQYGLANQLQVAYWYFDGHTSLWIAERQGPFFRLTARPPCRDISAGQCQITAPVLEQRWITPLYFHFGNLEFF